MFVGRERELELLKGLWDKPVASLVVCRGRRRIGKSRLIQEFATTASRFLEFQGLPPRPGLRREDQLEALSTQLAAQTSLPAVTLDGWLQALQLLNSVIDNRPTVVFLDEISWMALNTPDFAGALKIAWDTLFKKHDRLIVVLCGSVSSWIDQNILHSAGFVGRVSLDLLLRELPLRDCVRFWGAKAPRVSAVEKLKLLAVTGGVPRYLEEIRPGQSAEGNVRRLCFSPHGLLCAEFDLIFEEVFTRRALVYRQIVEALVDGARELHELCKVAGLERGGTISRYLDDLAMSGFVARDVSYDPGKTRPGRKARYRLCDNYLRFYLKYVASRRGSIEQGLFEAADISDLVPWDTLLGLQFENLVLNNVPAVLRALGLSAGRVASAAPYLQSATKRRRGCQVDLMIQSRRTLYICETKFGRDIRGAVLEQVAEKLRRLRVPDGYTARPVLLYAGRLSEAVANDDFFDARIDLADLLTV